MKKSIPLIVLTICILSSATGSAAADNSLGDFGPNYANADPKNSNLTIDQLTAAASKGKAQMQYELGMRYISGNGVPQNYQDAIRWLRKAADQRCAPALNRLGVCYEKGLGVPKNPKTAVSFYRKAANLGDADSQISIATCYLNGSGLKKIPLRRSCGSAKPPIRAQ